MRRIFSQPHLRVCFGALVWLAMLAGTPAPAAVIGFDDLLAGGVENAPIAGSYADFTWTNFNALNTALYTADLGPNGYANGVVSPHNVAYAGYGGPASFSAGQSFLLFSYAIGAAWNNDMTITVRGWRGGTLVYSDSFAVSATGSIQRQPGWANIDSVSFTASGGSSAGYRGLGTEFYLDDIVIGMDGAVTGHDSNPNEQLIPEPGRIGPVILAAAAVALAWHRLRRRRKAL